MNAREQAFSPLIQERPVPTFVGQGCCPSTQPERQPEIIAALNSLESTVARYENIANKLHNRLSAVTNPFNTPCEAIENAQYQTDLGNRINAIRCQVRDITDGLENLLERIEL